MKVLVLSDLHLGKYPTDLADVLTIELELRILRKAVETAVKEGAEGVILLGDVLDRWQYRTSFSVLEEMRKLFLMAELPAVLIRGNHEPLPGDPVYRAYSNDMFWFVTDDDGQFAVRLSEVDAPGAVGRFLKDLENIVAVPYPVDAPSGSRQATDIIRQVLRPGDVVFAHYFVDGYMPPGEERFIFPIEGHLIVGGHYHVPSYNPEDGVVIVGSLLPRDHFFADSLAHFGIYDLQTGRYKPYSIKLPYAFVRRLRTDAKKFVDDVRRFFEEHPWVKKLKIWHLIVPTPDDDTEIRSALKNEGLDGKVVFGSIDFSSNIASVGIDGGEDLQIEEEVTGNILTEFRRYLEMLQSGSVKLDDFSLEEGEIPVLVEELKRILEQVSGGGDER